MVVYNDYTRKTMNRQLSFDVNILTAKVIKCYNSDINIYNLGGGYE